MQGHFFVMVDGATAHYLTEEWYGTEGIFSLCGQWTGLFLHRMGMNQLKTQF